MFKAIIGYIVSSISEKALSHLFDSIWDRLFSGNNLITDWIYTRIAEGTAVNLTFYLFIVLGIYIVKQIEGSYTQARCNTKKCNKKCGSCDKPLTYGLIMVMKRRIKRLIPDRSRRERFYKTIKMGSIALLFVIFLTLTNYINHNVVRIRNNIEIVTPFVSIDEYNELKSMYYTMHSREEYDILCDKLDIIANDNQLVLQR